MICLFPSITWILGCILIFKECVNSYSEYITCAGYEYIIMYIICVWDRNASLTESEESKRVRVFFAEQQFQSDTWICPNDVLTHLHARAPNLEHQELVYRCKYSSIMNASTITVIALRHIHIYGMIVLWSTQCHACQSSQAKQCHMTQLRDTTKILFVCFGSTQVERAWL